VIAGVIVGGTGVTEVTISVVLVVPAGCTVRVMVLLLGWYSVGSDGV
jgi:hypothetical protein